jgi:hypothetical protein
MKAEQSQLQGLYIVLSTLLISLQKKGFFESGELEQILSETEETLTSDPNSLTIWMQFASPLDT